MKVAIIGAGFTGLALAWHLLHSPDQSKKTEVFLFDKKGIGKGASGIAAGLLHPYAGPEAKRSWNAEVAIKETFFLLEKASKALNKPCFEQRGIVRPAVSEKQKQEFYASSLKYNDTEWWDDLSVQSHITHSSWPALYIKTGTSVFCSVYLEGLFKACEEKGLHFHIQEIASLSEIEKDFDLVVFAGGAGALTFKETQEYPLNLTKGQLLVLKEDMQNRLHLPLISEKYITFSETQGELIAGATFERKWQTGGLTPQEAEKEIRSKISTFSQELSRLPLIEIRSGYRMWRAGYKPFVSKMTASSYAIGGMGSKGLLYHAWLAKLLASALVRAEAWQDIPKEVLL